MHSPRLPMQPRKDGGHRHGHAGGMRSDPSDNVPGSRCGSGRAEGAPPQRGGDVLQPPTHRSRARRRPQPFRSHIGSPVGVARHRGSTPAARRSRARRRPQPFRGRIGSPGRSQQPTARYAVVNFTSSWKSSITSRVGLGPATNACRPSRAAASASSMFAFATEIISLMRFSWFTSDAPGS